MILFAQGLLMYCCDCHERTLQIIWKWFSNFFFSLGLGCKSNPEIEPSLNCIVVYLITAQNHLHLIVTQRII